MLWNGGIDIIGFTEGVVRVEWKADGVAIEAVLFEEIGDVFTSMHPQLTAAAITLKLDSGKLSDRAGVLTAET
jgi:hypothetical protein